MYKNGPPPKISIVMPCLDEKHRVGPSIASLLQDAGNDLELLAVDGGSRDDTCEILHPSSTVID